MLEITQVHIWAWSISYHQKNSETKKFVKLNYAHEVFFLFIVFNFTKVFASACKLFNWIACCVGNWNIPSNTKTYFLDYIIYYTYLLPIKLCFCFFFQLFVIICLILARTGFAEGTAHFLALVDTEWVTITSVCSYTFIYPMLIICYLMGEVVPIKLVSLKQFWKYSFFYIVTIG